MTATADTAPAPPPSAADHRAEGQRRAASLLGLLAWVVGILFVCPVLWMVLTSLPQRGRRGDQPAVVRSPRSPWTATASSSAPAAARAPGRR